MAAWWVRSRDVQAWSPVKKKEWRAVREIRILLLDGVLCYNI